MAIDYVKLGMRIKRFRTDSNLSQEQLGEILLTNFRYISALERGNKKPSLEFLVNLANALKVTVDDLLTDSLMYSSSLSKSEMIELLLDCNEREKKILTKNFKTLKEILSETGV